MPTLVLDDGEALIESGAILDSLDEHVGPSRAMIAQGGAARLACSQGVRAGDPLADEAVSLFYERVLHEATSEQWACTLPDTDRRCAECA